jgi:glycerophosphoryl diester phosphodiesterase
MGDQADGDVVADDESPGPSDEEPELVRWAHQGGAKEGPSNTIWAMRRALARSAGGANALELDVHLSADGHLVVIHDTEVGRTTSGTGKVIAQTLDDLQQLDAAHWWRWGTVAAPENERRERHAGRYPLARWPGTDQALDKTVPTFEQVRELLRSHPGVPLTIEIKRWRASRPMVDAVRDMRAAGDRRAVTLAGIPDHRVWRARRWARKHDVAVGFSPGAISMMWFVVRARLPLSPKKAGYDRIQIPLWAARRPEVIDAAHRAGMAVDVWTIDDEDLMDELLELRVDGIMTDRPSALARVQHRRAEALGSPAAAAGSDR